MEFTVTNPQSGVPLTVDYRTVIDSNDNVRFFEDNSTATTTDTLNTHGEGILKPVPGSNSGSFGGFTASNLSGNYAFIFSGLDSAGKPEALGGIVNASGALRISQIAFPITTMPAATVRSRFPENSLTPLERPGRFCFLLRGKRS